MKDFDKGLSKDTVHKISEANDEPSWMLKKRLDAFEVFEKTKISDWGPGKKLQQLDFNKLHYFVSAVGKTARKWSDIPKEIRERYEKLGIPEAERKFLAGMGAQYESEMIYHVAREELKSRGVIFEDMNSAVKKHPELVEKYFGKLISPKNNKFAALNGAVWSGGSLVYIPIGVYLGMPLHNFFQMNLASQGQFERTIIIAEEGSTIEFLEGCVAPLYSETSVHAGVVEIFVGKEAAVKFTTMQNWSKNVWNLVTKAAKVEEGATIEWVDGNVGSGITMKYPTVHLNGTGARSRIFSLAFSGKNQIIDAGAKVFHNASETISTIESRSIVGKGGKAVFRGNVEIPRESTNCNSSVNCVALPLQEGCDISTYPRYKTEGENSFIQHESSILKISQEQLAYIKSRGLDEQAARGMIIGGFMEPFTSSLPMEYAVEFDRLIDLEINEGIG